MEDLQKEFLSCIWSADLKRHIAENNYAFDNEELLSIAYSLAPTYDERLRLLELLAEKAPEVAEKAKRCIQYQRECWDAFCERKENEVYELRILTDPDAYEERYLCENYQTALDTIDGFYVEYDCHEEDTARYVIAKRRILQATEAFREDGLEECFFGPGKVLISVDSRREGSPFNDLAEVLYPNFVPHLSAVRYREGDGSLGRGVCLSEQDGPVESCYIIPFEGELLKGREYEKKLPWHWHEHIPGPNVEILPFEKLTDEEKENYLAFAEYWKKRKS